MMNQHLAHGRSLPGSQIVAQARDSLTFTIEKLPGREECRAYGIRLSQLTRILNKLRSERLVQDSTPCVVMRVPPTMSVREAQINAWAAAGSGAIVLGRIGDVLVPFSVFASQQQAESYYRRAQLNYDRHRQACDFLQKLYPVARNHLETQLLQLGASLPPNFKAVDLACGSGPTSALWSRLKKAGVLIGIDKDEIGLEIFADPSSELEIETITGSVGQIRDKSFRACITKRLRGSPDALICTSAMHMFAGTVKRWSFDEFLSSAKELLAIGGSRLLLADYYYPKTQDESEGKRLVKEHIRRALAEQSVFAESDFHDGDEILLRPERVQACLIREGFGKVESSTCICHPDIPLRYYSITAELPR